MGINLKIGTLYKRMDFGFCSVEMPTDWEARYVTIDGMDQKNMIMIRLPSDVLPGGASSNSFTCQVSALDTAITPKICMEIENSINPGCQGMTLKESSLDRHMAILVETKEFPFYGGMSCTLSTVYIQNPKTLQTYRFGYWYEQKKEKLYRGIFEHMLQTVKIKDF